MADHTNAVKPQHDEHERRALELDQLEADAHAAHIRKPLKFEATAEIGDTIKAWDFPPREGVEDRFVIGRVIRKGLTPVGYAAFTILCDHDAMGGYRKGQEVFVPFQVSMLEWDTRVTRTMTAAEYRDMLRDHSEDLSVE